MPHPRHDLIIPNDLLARYLNGELTINDLAALVGASREITNRALRAQGVDTSVSAAKRRRRPAARPRALRGEAPRSAEGPQPQPAAGGRSLRPVAVGLLEMGGWSGRPDLGGAVQTGDRPGHQSRGSGRRARLAGANPAG